MTQYERKIDGSLYLNKSCTPLTIDECIVLDGENGPLNTACCSYPGCNKPAELPDDDPPSDWINPPSLPEMVEETWEFPQYEIKKPFDCGVQELFVKGGALIGDLVWESIKVKPDMDQICM